MGGKGRRRREKNYLAAHGGPARLPPPPDLSRVDALPSKLRQLISFTSTLHGSFQLVPSLSLSLKYLFSHCLYLLIIVIYFQVLIKLQRTMSTRRQILKKILMLEKLVSCATSFCFVFFLFNVVISVSEYS